MSFFTHGHDFLEYHNGGETLRITSWGESSFRVTSVPNGPLDLNSHALLLQKTSATINIDDEVAEISNGQISAVIDTRGWNSSAVITFYNDKKEPILKEINGGGALVKKARFFKAHIGGDFHLKATFEANPNEKIYGMGQYQQDILDLKGCNIELAHRNSQASIPFYVSSLGYGFLWHNPAIGSVSFGNNTTEWRADSTKQLDYWITVGDTPAKIEEQYSAVTGRAPMMPEYGLGFWQCKLRYHNQAQVLEVAREYHRRNIPVDVFVIDYYHWPRCGDFCFDEAAFPDPKAMVDELKSYGMEVMVSVWPQIDWRSENFQEMYQKGLLVQTDRGLNVQMSFHGNNVFYDATNPQARQYVWEKCYENYGKHGIKLFWLDEAEPEFTTYDFDNYRYFEGSVLQVGNIYPREYARGFFEGQKKSGQNDIINLVRCAWVGSQQYGTLIWSGDIHSTYEDFRNQIVAGLHMGLSGIPWWTTDIGGFHGGNIYDKDFQNLLIRWFQFGTFCPVMRLHGSRIPHEELFKANGEPTEWTGAPNEIWSYGEDNYQIMKKFIHIREAMRDYTRQLMADAHQSGAPVMRAMFYEFPDEKVAWELATQYMYGPDILVAPIVEAYLTTRQVFLPSGSSWTEAHTGDIFEGGQWLEVTADINTLPIFLRDGKQHYLIGLV
ncbi:glycosyl hydrolase [Halolactibacillus alkaliphilus]|uniref:Glycosyl hydrolase n=1 Tax=Halolactibacillus alkaliphilus TaxID=442899 RepID=A0A511WZL5_9BACI|nr:glycoside hydrolase family 31 protein [Halolactibacillus alkaliphilus]GEN56134.1 glycosyl hydrolase [Halolactibacillus alkaliphilus]GGN66979.1 glycosyl hydrolase [Halolactibacillus alkaliphilus]SFO71790.1 alpha-D-xyloside xylohydrolase [Halolactibacillus alkaliphilus]